LAAGPLLDRRKIDHVADRACVHTVRVTSALLLAVRQSIDEGLKLEAKPAEETPPDMAALVDKLEPISKLSERVDPL